MRVFLFLLLTCCSGLFSVAQKNSRGCVRGQILTTDNKPVDGAMASIAALHREAMTDESGSFLLKAVPPGNYTLTITYIGSSPVAQNLAVSSNDTTRITITLQLSHQQLNEVTVTAGHNRFNKKETDDVARLPLQNIENPQVYTVVTKELMKEQMVTDYNSIFRNIPGAGVPVVYNQGRSAMLTRGFTTANLIRNSISGFVYTNIDPANLEALEAIKGPSGTLFNSSQISFGGLFNRVTKKPFEGTKGEVNYSAGSYNLNRLTWDINTPLNEKKTVLMRMNAALHTEQSFQDAGFTRSAMLAPSLMYKINDKLSFLLDVEVTTFNATSPVRFAPATSGKVRNIKDLGLDYNRLYANNTLDYITRQLSTYGQLTYQINGAWKLQTNFTRTFSATKGYVTQLIGRSDSTLQQSVQKENFPYNGTEIQENLVGDFTIGKLRNRLVVGLDFYNQRSDRSTPTIALPVINFKRPGAAYNNFNADKVDSAAARAVFSVYRTNQYTYSAYASDVLNLTPQLNALLSLRIDRYVDKGTYYPAYDTAAGVFSQTALSPKFGLVYELVKNKLSVFGNYMNGFNNVNGQDFAGTTFKPQQANQWEVGVKADAFNHRLSSTVSYYNIAVSNITRDDPDHPGFSLQDGTQVSKGMEAEVIANPFGGLNIVAGYTYNDSRFTKANKTVEGLRPATAGPERLANAWVGYRILRGAAKGLGFGVGGNYGSAAFQTHTTAFVFTVPSYTVLDATVYYDRPLFRIGCKVDNLTNEKYWSYRLAPQMPTRVTANIAFRW